MILDPAARNEVAQPGYGMQTVFPQDPNTKHYGTVKVYNQEKGSVNVVIEVKSM